MQEVFAEEYLLVRCLYRQHFVTLSVGFQTLENSNIFLNL